MSVTSDSEPSEDHVSLFTLKRRREAARIVVVGILTLLYWGDRCPHRQSRARHDVRAHRGLGRTGPERTAAFTTPFSGIHGWYWENPGGTPITIRLNKETLVTRDKKKVAPTELKAGRSVVVDALGDSEADLLA